MAHTPEGELQKQNKGDEQTRTEAGVWATKKDFPQYFLTDEENWQVQFAQVQEWMQQNTTRPPMKTQLGSWLNSQLKLYKARKNQLGKEHIHKQFKDFLLKYPEHFANHIWTYWIFNWFSTMFSSLNKCCFRDSTDMNESHASQSCLPHVI